MVVDELARRDATGGRGLVQGAQGPRPRRRGAARHGPGGSQGRPAAVAVRPYMNVSGGPVAGLLKLLRRPRRAPRRHARRARHRRRRRPPQAGRRRGRPQRPALDLAVDRHQGLPPRPPRDRPPARAAGCRRLRPASDFSQGRAQGRCPSCSTTRPMPSKRSSRSASSTPSSGSTPLADAGGPPDLFEPQANWCSRNAAARSCASRSPSRTTSGANVQTRTFAHSPDTPATRS